jgi:hypothetical protein
MKKGNRHPKKNIKYNKIFRDTKEMEDSEWPMKLQQSHCR